MWIVTPFGNLVNSDHVTAIVLVKDDDTDMWSVKALSARPDISVVFFRGDQVECAQFLETLSKQMEDNTSGFIYVKDLLNE